MKTPLGVGEPAPYQHLISLLNYIRSFEPPVQGVPHAPLVPRLRDRNMITIKNRNEYKAIRQKKMKKPLGVGKLVLSCIRREPIQRITKIIDCRCRGCQMPP